MCGGVGGAQGSQCCDPSLKRIPIGIIVDFFGFHGAFCPRLCGFHGCGLVVHDGGGVGGDVVLVCYRQAGDVVWGG